MSQWDIIAAALVILIISVAVLVIRYGHLRFPYLSRGDSTDGETPER